MVRVVKPKNDVVLSNGIFLRRGAVATVYISNTEWKNIALSLTITLQLA